jgi:hypothetical protein
MVKVRIGGGGPDPRSVPRGNFTLSEMSVNIQTTSFFIGKHANARSHEEYTCIPNDTLFHI